jgi:predicted nucleic acid-binding protein
MTFADLLAGDAVFVDANILAYHFQPHPVWGPPCSNLLQRIENGELAGSMSTHVLSELSHRLMTIEASVLFGWPFTSIANRLRTHPARVQQLTAFRLAVDRVLQGSLQVLVIAPPLVSTAAALSQQFGLLSNDALIVTVMQANGLTRIASNDADFDRIPWLTRYEPN